MSHPFGDLLSQHIHRKHGLSQARLAAGILQDPSTIGKMCKGERLTGPQARERVLAIISWLHGQAALTSSEEANALLIAAGMAPLRDGEPADRPLMPQLRPPMSERTTTTAPFLSVARKTNLPAPLTTFVGRAQDIATVTRAIAAHRLVTLTGAGGIGKTRLAVEAGIRLVWEGNSSVFADGVWFIELAALIRGAMDSALLTQAIAGAFKQSGQVEPITLNLLQESLAGKQMLLILDNCEHLVDACAEIAERLLHRCWQLHILATSREKLRVPGEMVYAVPPLALPDPAARTPAHVLSTPAARLFVERIGIAPSIHKTREEDAVAIAQICRQLDGIPLALELAAPLAHNMTFTEIAAQLHNQMAILTNNYRTAIPRHQTMYSALVWGYHLLAPDEQQLLARVSVFAGGWTLTACQSVCGAESGNSLLLPLHQLVAKSFVLVAYLDGERRYHLLEPIRQFAHAQLVASGEQETTRRRHAAYYLTLAAEMGQARDTPQEQAWLQRLEPERNNLRAVNEWALAHNEAEFARQFNGLLFVYWIYCSSQAEADHWLEAALGLQAIEGNGARTPTALSAEIMALDAAGYAAVGLLDYERAQAHFAHEMALCAAIGDQKGVAAALRGCGFTGMLAGDLVQAQVCDEDALALSKKAQDHRGIAWVLYDLGYLALVRGELNVAQALLEEALPSLRQLGINFGAYRALLALGHVARASGEPDRAGGLYRDALRLQQAMHYTQYVADGLEGLAGIAAQAGDPVRAAWLFAAAQTQRDAIAMSHWQHQVAGYERDVELARRQLDPESWRTAWEAGSVMTLKQAVEHALSS